MAAMQQAAALLPAGRPNDALASFLTPSLYARMFAHRYSFGLAAAAAAAALSSHSQQQQMAQMQRQTAAAAAAVAPQATLAQATHWQRN